MLPHLFHFSQIMNITAMETQPNIVIATEVVTHAINDDVEQMRREIAILQQKLEEKNKLTVSNEMCNNAFTKYKK